MAEINSAVAWTASCTGIRPAGALAAFSLAFGAWDLAFYGWLRVLIAWPRSLYTWDVLFLLPVPWVAPVLAPAITDTLAGVPGRARSAVIPTLHKDRPDLDAVAAALAALHNHGHPPAWRRLYPHARVIALPTYAFQHRSYWVSPAPGADVAAAGLGRPEHPLLGAVTDLADQDQVMWSARLSLSLRPGSSVCRFVPK